MEEQWRKVVFLYESKSNIVSLMVDIDVGRDMGTPKQSCGK
jgi:hypothetical protein